MKSTEETRARAKVIYDYLVANPQEHNQRSYGRKTSCGTTMCIAGKAIIEFRPDLVKWEDLGGGIFSLESWLQDANGRDIDVVAGELLGLNSEEACGVFMNMNEGRALAALLKIANGETLTYDDLSEDNDPCSCEACI